MGRISAQDRRGSVIHAAIAEFAVTGFYGTSTEAIARRVGVSQPYLSRLMEDTRLAFRQAAKGVPDGEQTRRTLANTYARLNSTHPDTFKMQMQACAIVAAATPQGDDEIGELVRADGIRLWPRSSSHAACSAMS